MRLSASHRPRRRKMKFSQLKTKNLNQKIILVLPCSSVVKNLYNSWLKCLLFFAFLRLFAAKLFFFKQTQFPSPRTNVRGLLFQKNSTSCLPTPFQSFFKQTQFRKSMRFLSIILFTSVCFMPSWLKSFSAKQTQFHLLTPDSWLLFRFSPNKPNFLYHENISLYI